MAFHPHSDLEVGNKGGNRVREVRAGKAGRRRSGPDEIHSLGVAALDLLPHALLVVDAEGTVLGTNTAADRLLAKLDGLIRTPAGIEARVQWENELLLRAIAQMVAAEGESEVEVLKISRPSGLTPYSVAVAPVRGSGRRASRAAAIFIHDPVRSRVPTADQLGRLHDLTRMEAVVARDLASGLSLKEIASEHDICLNTVRGHLKQVFAKTGTHRQAQLVARILSGPQLLAFEAA